MALRILLYIGRIYEKIIQDKKIYSSKKILIPKPEFFVLYNGLAPYPDEEVLKLSDSFEKTASLGLAEKEKPSLELKVKVININEGKNAAIAKKCKTLSQYSVFIAKVREYENESNSRPEAIKKAVIYCRYRDILKEFLEKNSSEVVNMLLTEWNWDDAKQVWQEEAREEGFEKGRREGQEKGHEEGTQEERFRTAASFKKLGIPLEVISQATGLSLEKIQQL